MSYVYGIKDYDKKIIYLSEEHLSVKPYKNFLNKRLDFFDIRYDDHIHSHARYALKPYIEKQGFRVFFQHKNKTRILVYNNSL